MIQALEYLWGKIKAYLDMSHTRTRSWNFAVDTIVTSQTATYFNGCTGLMFTNVGDTIVTVNNKILYPGTVGSILGDSYSVAAHKDDVFKGTIKVSFVPGGANPQLEMVQVYYMDVQQR